MVGDGRSQCAGGTNQEPPLPVAIGATDDELAPIMVGSVMESARGVDDDLWRRVPVLVLDVTSPPP